MNKNNTSKLLLAVALLGASSSAYAALLVEDTSNYANGTRIASDFTIANTATGYQGNIATNRGNGSGSDAAQIDVVSPSLSYGSLTTSNNKLVLDYNGFGTHQDFRSTLSASNQTVLNASGATYFTSFLFQTPSAFVLNDGMQILGNRSDFADYWRFRAIGTSSSTAEWSVGVNGTFSSGVSLTTNTTYLAVMKIVRTGATDTYTVDGWVSSTGLIAASEGALGAAGASISATAGSNNVMNNIYYRAQGDNITSPFQIDEFRIGTTYLDVVPSAIPEPSSYAALAGLGAIGLALHRRRRATRRAA